MLLFLGLCFFNLSKDIYFVEVKHLLWNVRNWLQLNSYNYKDCICLTYAKICCLTCIPLKLAQYPLIEFNSVRKIWNSKEFREEISIISSPAWSWAEAYKSLPADSKGQEKLKRMISARNQKDWYLGGCNIIYLLINWHYKSFNLAFQSFSVKLCYSIQPAYTFFYSCYDVLRAQKN